MLCCFPFPVLEAVLVLFFSVGGGRGVDASFWLPLAMAADVMVQETRRNDNCMIAMDGIEDAPKLKWRWRTRHARVREEPGARFTVSNSEDNSRASLHHHDMTMCRPCARRALMAAKRAYSTGTGRDYNAAVAALNGLQSNFSIVEAIRKAGPGWNTRAIPEMLSWVRRIGYEVGAKHSEVGGGRPLF